MNLRGLQVADVQWLASVWSETFARGHRLGTSIKSKTALAKWGMGSFHPDSMRHLRFISKITCGRLIVPYETPPSALS